MVGNLDRIGSGVRLARPASINWLRTGTWGLWGSRTIAETWPAITDSIATTNWIGVQRIGLWVIEQPIIWVVLFLGLALCLASLSICGFVSDLLPDLEARWQKRQSRLKGR